MKTKSRYPLVLRVRVTKLSLARKGKPLEFSYQTSSGGFDGYTINGRAHNMKRTRLKNDDILVVLKKDMEMGGGYSPAGLPCYQILLPSGELGWVFLDLVKWAQTSGWFVFEEVDRT